MQTRREFLISAAQALGGWFIGGQVASKLLWLARERKTPYLVKVSDPEYTLWANRFGNEYVLTLYLPWGESNAPELTWEDWFDRHEVNWKNRDQLREHLIDWNCYEPNGEPFVCPRLQDPVPEELQRYFEEYEFPVCRQPAGRAYDYLAGLPLADHTVAGPNPLGSLVFIDGYHPGDNTYEVHAHGVETLGGLQQRLLQLGEGVEIVLNEPESPPGK